MSDKWLTSVVAIARALLFPRKSNEAVSNMQTLTSLPSGNFFPFIECFFFVVVVVVT